MCSQVLSVKVDRLIVPTCRGHWWGGFDGGRGGGKFFFPESGSLFIYLFIFIYPAYLQYKCDFCP